MADNKDQMRQMTHEEVVEMVHAKERNCAWIQDNMGIFGMPYASERDSLKYWRDVLAGREPRPLVAEKRLMDHRPSR